MNFEIFSGKAENWDNWLLVHGQDEFLQSYEWGDFQAVEGKEALRILMRKNEEIVLQVQGFVHHLPFGLKYVYLPRSQKLDIEQWKALSQFLKTQGFAFARVEPVEDFGEVDIKKVKTHHRQYQYTSLIDLTQSDEELLKSFHEKTRYNIRLAAKKGIVVKKEKNADIFWPLLKETYQRDGIKSHSEKYYRDFIALPGCTQLTAYFEDTPLASVLLYTFGKTSVYVHGASSNLHRNLMAPYLIQFEALQCARGEGCTQYDLGGVAKTVASNDPNAETFFHYSWDKNDKLSGVTRFKAGFDGTIKHSADACDIVFQKNKYFLYTLARKFL